MSDGKTNYVSGVFTHWYNLAFLGSAGIAGLVFGWPAVLAATLIEAGILWIAPDLPPIRRALDSESVLTRLQEQRNYYIKSIWGVMPPRRDPILGFIFNEEPDWESAFETASYGFSREQLTTRSTFRRLLQIVKELRELNAVKPEAITGPQILRVEEAINAWMAQLYTIKALKDRLNRMDKRELQTEYAELQQLAAASDDQDRAAKVVLAERLRTLKKKVEDLPRIEHALGLALAQADALVDHIEGVHSQAKASGAAEASAMLDSMVDRYTLSGDGLDHMVTASEVRGLLAESSLESQQTWDDLARTLDIEADAEEGVALPRRRSRRREAQ